MKSRIKGMSKTHLQKIAEAKDTGEIFDNPEEYGMPSFDEFCRNREKYMGREDDRLIEVDRGSQTMRRNVSRHVYEIEGYRCKSLEEVERIAANQGIPLRELDYRPQVLQAGAGKFDLVVRFVSKSERERRNKWR
jgi:hypothetical protein